MPSFDNRLATIDLLLSAETFRQIRSAVTANMKGERVHIPGHKRGVTISYEALHRCAPEIIALYHSPRLEALCSKIVGVGVKVTPIHDQSSCSVLCYEAAGDRIGWHRDLNFYKGRHFTVLLSLINENKSGELSSAELMVCTTPGKVVAVPTPPNTFVIFEGARVWHAVTPLGEDERRIVLSMTFSTDPTATLFQSTGRRFKDIAYYGVRALWT